MDQLDHLLLKRTLTQFQVDHLKTINNLVLLLVRLLLLLLTNHHKLVQLLHQVLKVLHQVKSQMQQLDLDQAQELPLIKEVVHQVLQVLVQLPLKVQLAQHLMLMLAHYQVLQVEIKESK